MGGKVPRNQLAPRGAHCSTPPLTITLSVPCTFAALGGAPSSGSDGDSNISGHRSNKDNGGSRWPAPQPGLGAPPLRPVRPAHTYRSSEQWGGAMVTRFQSMLTRLGLDALPAYYSKVVYRADDRCEWCTMVHIFDGELLYRRISGTSCCSTREDAEADATWRAISTLSPLFEDHLQNTPFHYYPHRTMGTDDRCSDGGICVAYSVELDQGCYAGS
jgi:hypothetical protein